MQSGISATKELREQFDKLLSDGSLFALVATIASEELRPVALLPRSSPGASFESDLGQLAPHLQPKAATYILLRRYESTPYLTAVTYVPDTAPVRQKMLFASSRLSLVRDLGSEHFRDSIFATMAEELTAKGFAKHDAHEKLEAPLTEEERTLGAVKNAEAQAGYGSGTGTKEIHLSQSLSMPMEEAALDALKALAEESGGVTLVTLKINPTSEVVELDTTSSSASSIDDLLSAISTAEPRFSFFRYAHGYGGGEFNPVLFFYTCPQTAGGAKAVKSRMIYPLMKRAVVTIAEKEAGLTPEKRFEVDDPAEITEQMVLDDLHPKVTARQGFSRPKRPGR